MLYRGFATARVATLFELREIKPTRMACAVHQRSTHFLKNIFDGKTHYKEFHSLRSEEHIWPKGWQWVRCTPDPPRKEVSRYCWERWRVDVVWTSHWAIPPVQSRSRLAEALEIVCGRADVYSKNNESRSSEHIRLKNVESQVTKCEGQVIRSWLERDPSKHTNLQSIST